MTLSDQPEVIERIDVIDVVDAPNEIELEREADRWSSEHEEREREINVGKTERQISAIAGGALALLGLRQRSAGGIALAGLGAALIYRGATGSCPMYRALDIDTNSDRQGLPTPPEEFFKRGIHVEEVMTVNKSPEELYAYWRNFSNLPQIMEYLKSVTCLDDTRSHWVAEGPAGHLVEWDAEIINDEPNRTIAWRSLANSEVDNAGSVRFVLAPGDRGTEVKVVIDYIPPAGKIGWVVAKLFGKDPAMEIREDLRRFKRVMETGEAPTIDEDVRGSCR